MANRIVLRPKPCLLPPFRPFTTTTAPSRRHRLYGPPRPHEHSIPSSYPGSWKNPPPTSDPREALRRLQLLRQDYTRKVKVCRKQYIYEVETQRQEKLRKEEARREAARVAKEERKAAKKEADEVRAAKHRAFQEELRQTLMKERAEKLEIWRAREAVREKKKAEQRELLRKQSSMWIDEGKLEKKIIDSLIDISIL